MKNYLFLTVFTAALILIAGCVKDEVVAPNTQPIEYLLFKNNGCLQTGLLKKVDDAVTIKWTHQNDTLVITADFTTNCAAILSDSVHTSDSEIEVYLRDISDRTARCICPHKDVFIFNAEAPKTINFTLYYRQRSDTEYYPLATTNIILE